MAGLRLPGTIGFKCWFEGCRYYDGFFSTEQVDRTLDPLHPQCPSCTSYVQRADWFAWRPPFHGRSFRTWEPAPRLPTFVSFASEDARYRDFFVKHSYRSSCPYQVIDYSAHDAFDDQWKRRMLQRIRQSAVTVMLISQDTYRAPGAIWEVETSLIEGIPVFGIRIHPDRWVRYPSCLLPEHVIHWTWDGIAEMFAEAATYHSSRSSGRAARASW